MIIFYACLSLVVVLAVLPHHSLRRLALVRLRHTWLVWLALADQILVISVLPGTVQALGAAAHLASYGLAGAFAIANRRLPGAGIVMVGGLSNLSAIAANGGTMPASADALARSGWHAAPGHFANSATVSHARLSWLGDVFATPPWLPLHSVFSIGDIVIVAGVALFLHRVCHSTASGDGRTSPSAAADPSQGSLVG